MADESKYWVDAETFINLSIEYNFFFGILWKHEKLYNSKNSADK